MFKFIPLRSIVVFVVFTIISTNQLYSQCAITDLVITNSVCDANEEFSIELNFNYTDTGTNGFQVLGNGNNYGTFQYADLPISIAGLMGNCELAYEFIVRDVIDPTCAAFLDYGIVCCDDVCSLLIDDFETTECMPGLSFDINLNLDFEFTGQNGYSASINGESVGSFEYEDLPLNIPSVSNIEVGNNTLTICDNDFPDCCDTYTFQNPCFCSIDNINTTIVDCNSIDSSYYVIIDFDVSNSNDSFQMSYLSTQGNQYLGIFAYADLPVTTGPLFLADFEQEIFIADSEDLFCFNGAFLGVVNDCDINCQIYNVFAEAYMCEEAEYFIDVEFEAEDIEGYSFDILVDGTSYGTFNYGDNFYTVGPIPSNCDVAPTVVIQDNNLDQCSDFFNFSEPICCLADCNFTSLEIETVCDETVLIINGVFENNGQALSSFYFVELLGTSYGPFPYGDFMFSIDVPLLANGEYEITVNDSQDLECSISTTFMTDCDEEACMIFDVFAEALECDGSFFYIDIEFDFGGSVSDSFNISGNGINYGTFAYGQQFYNVGPVYGDCETIYEFFVSDQILEGCNSFFAFDEAICCMEEICEINDIVVSEIICSDSLTISSFELFFQYFNPTSDQFTISINGIDDPALYNYADLPIIIDYEISNIFSITVQDAENEICQFTSMFDIDCSDDCDITNVETEFIECSEDGNTYFVSMDFDYLNTDESFILWTGSVNQQDTFAYADLPIVVGPLLVGISQFLTIINIGGTCSAQEITLLEECTTHLEEELLTNIQIYQSNNSIVIENNEAQEIEFHMYSVVGELLYSNQVRSNDSNAIELDRFSTGIYLLSFSDGIVQKTIKVINY